MNSRKAQIRKNDTYLKTHFTNQYSRPEEKKNWLIVIISFLLQLLAAILSNWKGRRRRLGR